jgi:hypothetical protein
MKFKIQCKSDVTRIMFIEHFVVSDKCNVIKYGSGTWF